MLLIYFASQLSDKEVEKYIEESIENNKYLNVNTRLTKYQIFKKDSCLCIKNRKLLIDYFKKFKKKIKQNYKNLNINNNRKKYLESLNKINLIISKLENSKCIIDNISYEEDNIYTLSFFKILDLLLNHK